ncbi:telomere zinc finger-associated protein-like [Maniola jurtina]|uniref:telomere zinc finger-associated protein-like n=1 Tax=Maniola jurtina TaxID=191418 RepID=UPI001E68D49B|nr:telomere zinc finger-associated protein-like [Maniola jurtina]
MEFIHLLLNSEKGDTCFLCYRKSLNTQNISSNLEVKSQLFDDTLSLANMIISLFPSFELTLTKSCDNCADLIIRMYITMRRNNVQKTIFNNIIDSINKEINYNNISSFGKLDININLSKVMDVRKQPLKASDKYDCSNTTDENYDELMTNKFEEQSSTQENQCPNCYKVFDSIKKFKTHMKSHKRSRKKVYYTCNNCNYKSLCKESLQGHIHKKHLKIRPHVCDICFKDFYHRKNLVEHSKRHLEVRNEICEVCGDRFIHKKNLLEHLKLHSGERPYLCEVCDRRFITSGRRLEHIKRCHSEKNECCLLCNKKFGLIKELTRHIKAVHS